MAVQSKPIIRGNCQELVHPWSPTCTVATKEFIWRVFVQSLKLYFPLYTISALLQRSGLKDYFMRVAPMILQSTLFLTVNGGLLMPGTCILRKLFGGYHYWSVLLLPGLISSLLAILVERKGRRSVLMVYVVSLAAESVYNMLKHRKMIRPVPFGEVLLFMIASALTMRSIKLQIGQQGLLEAFVKILFSPQFPAFLTKYLPRSESFVGRTVHVFEIICWSFLLGYCIRGLYKSIGLLFQGPKAWLKKGEITRKWLNKENLRCGAFLGLFTGSYKVISVVLRSIGVSESVNPLVAGGIAGMSMAVYGSSAISIYTFFKSLERCFYEAASHGWVKPWYYGDVLLYTLATPIILHCAALEPFSIRLEYYNFALRLCGNRIQDFNQNAVGIWNPEVPKFILQHKKRNRPKEVSPSEE